ncbi:expressed unknown protein [Seminavis robusta]|uniref:SET domain-containing protein n=1 Tax=Seminavis robusta TaxID=568900 RepID=A0A9N8EWQ7_9STRA|nr:expressed unknown protein [Seminavis robusta]|eukprot:Sro2284_g321880.1 n/a (435) ;mRNA; f:3683-4987
MMLERRQRMVALRWVVVILLVVCLSSPVVSSETESSEEPSSKDDNSKKNTNDLLLEWVLSKGGYWNDKQTLGFDQNGIFGVFAAQHIQDNEILAQIPWSCVIHTTPPSKRRFDNCDTVTRLKDEFAKGNQSDYHPYTQALLETAQVHRSLLPAHWSAQGQELLKQVLATTIPPQDMFLTLDWKHRCEQVHKDATLLVMTHGEDFGMVPITDRYNSRGGDYMGAYFAMAGKNNSQMALEIRAFRNLEPGEQIFTDYHDYGQIGTPELLRDYGFVELYPQKFIFHHLRVAFDIEVYNEAEDDDDEEQPVLQVTWLHQHEHMAYFHPREHYESQQSQQHIAVLIDFFQREHERLQQHVCPSLQHTAQSNDSIPKQERDTTITFCHAVMVAMEAALDDLGIPVPQPSNLRQLGIAMAPSQQRVDDTENCEDGNCSDEL